jgi:hypothetical protein
VVRESGAIGQGVSGTREWRPWCGVVRETVRAVTVGQGVLSAREW